MHWIGYRISSCTSQELVIDGRNYLGAAFLWLITGIIGLLIPALLFWLIFADPPGTRLSGGAQILLFLTALVFMSALLMPFCFFDGIIRRVIRLSRPENSMTATQYIASGRHRSNVRALGHPVSLQVKILHSSGRVGPLLPTLKIGLRYAQTESLYLIGSRSLLGLRSDGPSLRAGSHAAKEIISTLSQWLNLPVVDSDPS